VARETAESSGAEVIDIAWRDADVPLSDLGEAQAKALGGWLGERSEPIREVWSSPYVRARRTLEIALDGAGLTTRVNTDDRLRDRELGVLDRLTGSGVRARFAAEAERRRTLGKLYYRPPGGESWADVALRLRSFVQELEEQPGRTGTVLIGGHDAVVMLFRYILERLDEATLLDLAARCPVPNASVTRIFRPSLDSAWQSADFGSTAHLHQFGAIPSRHGADTEA
jgi:broad specificity phosphatase PhoE